VKFIYRCPEDGFEASGSAEKVLHEFFEHKASAHNWKPTEDRDPPVSSRKESYVFLWRCGEAGCRFEISGDDLRTMKEQARHHDLDQHQGKTSLTWDSNSRIVSSLPTRYPEVPNKALIVTPSHPLRVLLPRTKPVGQATVKIPKPMKKAIEAFLTTSTAKSLSLDSQSDVVTRAVREYLEKFGIET
jgi:predicted small metal-binding protein